MEVNFLNQWAAFEAVRVVRASGPVFSAGRELAFDLWHPRPMEVVGCRSIGQRGLESDFKLQPIAFLRLGWSLTDPGGLKLKS